MSRLTYTLTLCAAALFACSTAVYAAPDSDMPPPHYGQPHGGMMHDLEKIHAQLNLTPAQEQQWQAAVAAAKSAREQGHAAFAQAHQQMDTLMQAPVLDLRAISAAHQQMDQQAHQAHAQVEENWLKLYDSLDTTQKTLVSTALKAKWQKMAARRAKMAAHWGKKPQDAAASQAQ